MLPSSLLYINMINVVYTETNHYIQSYGWNGENSDLDQSLKNKNVRNLDSPPPWCIFYTWNMIVCVYSIVMLLDLPGKSNTRLVWVQDNRTWYMTLLYIKYMDLAKFSYVVIIRASLRSQKRLNFLINPWYLLESSPPCLRVNTAPQHYNVRQWILHS